jgi:hypothetical protein
VIAHTFDDGDGAGIPHRETLTGDAAQIAFTTYRAIKHGIADDDRLFRDEANALMRLDDQLSAGNALADIVVRFTRELQRHAMGEKSAKALAGNAGEADPYRVLRQSRMAVALRHFT